jgi:hypothetical protein
MNDKIDLKNARFIVYGEILFAVFPFLIKLLIIFSGYTKFSEFFNSSDWSLAGSILVGQAIIRYMSGAIKQGRNVTWQMVSFQQSVIFVLAALCFVTYGIYQSQTQHSLFLLVWQFFLFLISVIVFLGFGSAGQYFLDKPKKRT